MPEAPPDMRRPASLLAALGVLAAETVALAGLTGYLIYADLVSDATTFQGAIGLTLFTALMAGMLGLLTWSLFRGRGWARGPSVVLQLLLVPIGYYMITGGLPALGVPVIAVGLIGAGALLAPATRASMDRN
jgi:hypothetical protein